MVAAKETKNTKSISAWTILDSPRYTAIHDKAPATRYCHRHRDSRFSVDTAAIVRMHRDDDGVDIKPVKTNDNALSITRIKTDSDFRRSDRRRDDEATAVNRNYKSAFTFAKSYSLVLVLEHQDH